MNERATVPRRPMSGAGVFLTAVGGAFVVVGLFHVIVLLALTLVGEEDKPSLAETLAAMVNRPWHPLSGYSTVEQPPVSVYVLFVPVLIGLVVLAWWLVSRTGRRRQARETGTTLIEDVGPLHREAALEYSRKILPKHVPDEERVIYLGKLL